MYIWVGQLAIAVISVALLLGVSLIIYMVWDLVKYQIYKNRFITYYPTINIENDPKLKKIINYFLTSKIKYILKHLEDETELNEIWYLHSLNEKIKKEKISKEDWHYLEHRIEKMTWV